MLESVETITGKANEDGGFDKLSHRKAVARTPLNFVF